MNSGGTDAYPLSFDIGEQSDGGTDDYYTDVLATLESDLQTAYGPDSYYGGTLDSTIAATNVPIFADFDGEDDDLNTGSDNDWRLVSPTDEAVYAGGWKASTTGTNRAGIVRGDTWSIGAWEYDGQ